MQKHIQKQCACDIVITNIVPKSMGQEKLWNLSYPTLIVTMMSPNFHNSSSIFGDLKL
jgi:hypothetical protein